MRRASPFHPATKIFLWLCFALAVQGMDLLALALASVPVAAMAALQRSVRSLAMLRRARWLLISLFLVYGFATPGAALLPALGSWSPSLPGTQAGALQAWRLALLLSGLAVLLQSCSRNGLLAGIHLLLSPLRIACISPERIAVRLWLTLHYAEMRPRDGWKGSWRELGAGSTVLPAPLPPVILETPPFTWRDGALLAAAVLVGAALW